MTLPGDETRRIAIGCQGGGVHSAFAAGALKRLLREEKHEVVALSGTSGGSICAFWPGTRCWRTTERKPPIGLRSC